MDNQNDTLHLNTDAVKVKISKDEAIHRIENIYHAQYDPDSTMDAWDQLLACEAVDEATPISDTYFDDKDKPNESVSVNGSVNDIYKPTVNFELTHSKLQVISQLKTCTYRTPPKVIAELLGEFFIEYPSKPGHWSYIAQYWPPRPIYRVIDRITQLHSSGRLTIQNHAAFFTYLIKHRKRRKSFMSINASCKQQEST